MCVCVRGGGGGGGACFITAMVTAHVPLFTPAFSKKSEGTRYWTYRCALYVTRGAWFRVYIRYLVSATPPTVLGRSF